MHSLQEHLEGTAKLAAEFAGETSNPDKEVDLMAGRALRVRED